MRMLFNVQIIIESKRDQWEWIGDELFDSMSDCEELLDCFIKVDKYIIKINAKIAALRPPYWIQDMIIDNLYLDEHIVSITYDT